MQQIYLTGDRAGEVAAQVLTSLRVKTAGYRLLPLVVEGKLRGQVMRLLTAPDAPYQNDVPCAVQLAPGETKVIREVYGKLAAPALRQAVTARVPIFIDGVCREALKAKAFAEALNDCLHGRCQVVAVVEKDAVAAIRKLTLPEEQLWLMADAENENETLRKLLQELSMRI